MDCGVGGPQHCRAQSHSTDGGESWSPRLPVPSLPDPQIKGGIDRWPQGGGSSGGTLVFANAAGVAAGQINTHLTISLSSDNGKTWPRKHLLWKGGTGYTVLQYVGNDTAAVFYREQRIGGSGGSLEPPGLLLEPPGASSYAPPCRLYGVL